MTFKKIHAYDMSQSLFYALFIENELHTYPMFSCLLFQAKTDIKKSRDLQCMSRGATLWWVEWSGDETASFISKYYVFCVHKKFAVCSVLWVLCTRCHGLWHFNRNIFLHSINSDSSSQLMFAVCPLGSLAKHAGISLHILLATKQHRTNVRWHMYLTQHELI